MAVACPNCGKPVRPGSKFCSKCGAEMPGTLPLSRIEPAAPPPAPAEQPATAPCPHCGKPVRPGAKFCPACGQSIPAVGSAPPVPLAGTAQAAAMEPAPDSLPPIPPVKTTPQPPAGPPPKPGRAPSAAKHKGSKKWLLLVIAGLLLFTCLALVISLAVFRDRIPALVGRASTTPTEAVLPSETVTPTPEPTTTATEQPTLTVTPTPSMTPTRAITGTESTATGSPEASAALFEDDFTAGWEKNWTSWGALPVVGGENISLTLNSASLTDAGIASKEPITLIEDVTIEFAIKLNGSGPQDVIFFDWSVGTEARTTGDPPGAVHLQVGAGKIQLEIADSSTTYKSCAPKPFNGVDLHIYQIEVEDDWKIKLQMDGKEVCELRVKPYIIGTDYTGMLSFTGRGTLDDIRVSRDD